jgi:phosphatidylinositol glycan class B
LLVAYRIINALIVQTSFDPDEYWQSLEVAHNKIYGYGYLTWEWKVGLRSFLHPGIFALLYKLLQILSLDSARAMIVAPKILQGIFAAICDYFTYKLAFKTFSASVAQWTLILQLTNWFNYYCLVRTYSNSLETTLTIAALYYWPLSSSRKDKNESLFVALIIAALACIIRPTNGVLWAFIGVTYFLKVELKKKLQFALFYLLPIGAFAIGFSLLVDYLFYGRWIFVIWNFIQFNVIADAGSFYGTHPWYWYIVAAVPTLAHAYLPLVIGGAAYSPKKFLLAAAGWYIFVFSFISHKEFRFLLPILPVMLIYAGYFMDMLNTRRPKGSRSLLSHPLFMLLLLANLGMALYFSTLHQRGTTDVMWYIQQNPNVGEVMFLMPCHSTPYYAYVHRNIPMNFLDCSPRPGEKDYIDEADRFYLDPQNFLQEYYKNKPLPSHLVMYNVLVPQIATFLLDNHYNEVHLAA